MGEIQNLRNVPVFLDSSPTNGYTTSSEKSLKRALEVGSGDLQTYKRAKLPDRTDYSRWRLLDERGRQTWHYLADDEAAKKWPQSTADKYFLGLPTVKYPIPSL